jgi:uncharacterized membrane protein
MPQQSHHPQTGQCAATGRTLPLSELVPLTALRPKVAETVRAQFPDLADDAHVSMSVINNARLEYARDVLEEQIGDLSKLDEEVVESLARHEILSERPFSEAEEDMKLTFGQRVADKIAEVGGSWTFILGFGVLLLIWICINTVLLATRAFDPYPFILLNLVLSCIAALQAPVIMMSQNRQEQRDRTHAENDYKVNLKAELEIRHLHEKMDYLLHQHARRLMELQHMQLESLRELARTRSSDGHHH